MIFQGKYMKFIKCISNHCSRRHEYRITPPTRRVTGFLLCALISASLAACSQGAQNLSEDSSKTQDVSETNSTPQENGNSSSKADDSGSNSTPQEDNGSGSNADSGEAGNKEPVLEAGASDEELLEVLKDDIHVVSDAEFHDIATGILERTAEYTGKIYQLEGVLKMDGATLCLAHDTEDDAPLLPLKYLKSNFKEGDTVRITGIANQDTESDSTAVLEVIVAQAL